MLHVAKSEVFGRIVALLRERVGLSSRDLAKVLGVGSATVARIEAGRSVPTIVQVEAICEALNRTFAKGDRDERWTPVRVLSLFQHVVAHLGPYYEARWKPQGDDVLRGRAVVGLIIGPFNEWLASNGDASSCVFTTDARAARERAQGAGRRSLPV